MATLEILTQTFESRHSMFNRTAQQIALELHFLFFKKHSIARSSNKQTEIFTPILKQFLVLSVTPLRWIFSISSNFEHRKTHFFTPLRLEMSKNDVFWSIFLHFHKFWPFALSNHQFLASKPLSIDVYGLLPSESEKIQKISLLGENPKT